MAQLLALNTWLNDLVWGPPFMVLLFGVGVHLPLRLADATVLGAMRYPVARAFSASR